MKFSCGTPDLQRSLQMVSRAIGGQQALPILGNILLQAEGNRCTVSATDLELSIVTSFEASIENEGSITIPAKAIVNIAQYCSDPEILLETIEGTQLRCVSKKSKAMLSGEAATEYPTIPSIDRQISIALPIPPLLRALHYVTFAAARTSLRPVLSGVSIRCEKGAIIFAATDSYRLSEYTIPAGGIKEEFSCIIPVKVLEELKLILGGIDPMDQQKGPKPDMSEQMVEVALSKQQVEFVLGHHHLLSRLIEGKFPDYKQIIPKEEVTTTVFATHELQTAVKRMHYFAKEVNNTLTFSCSKGNVRVSTPQTQAGKDEATFELDVQGADSKIALSSSYLLDFLGHVGSESLVLHIADSMRPAVFTLPEDTALLHLIMPLRLQEE
jgi:DNA polymerase III subunit beta